MDIASYLKQLPDKPIFFYPNPGNAGDSAISCTILQLLDRQGRQISTHAYALSYRLPESGIVMCGGGGTFIGNEEKVFNLMAEYHNQVERLVILPQTIVGRAALLRSFGANVDVICRERISYDYVVGLSTQASVFLMDDMAFSLDTNWLLAHPIRCLLDALPWLLRYRRIDKYLAFRKLKRERHAQAKRFGASAATNCFRTNAERTDIPLPPDNLDLSLIAMFGTRPRALARLVTYELLAFLREFAVVNTNRLHIGILAAILGKQVNFYPNNFKNEGVYQFSMASRFPNVRWCGNGC